MGRQLAFDREQLLEQVMTIFWKRGYQATSISHLVEETRVQPGSLYHSFQNKRGLLLAALDHYAGLRLALARESLHRHERFAEAVDDFIRRTLDRQASGGEGRSCFLITTWLELGAHDPTIKRCVERNLARIEGLFCRAAADAQARGELSPREPPETLAKLVMTTLWGMRMLGATDVDPRQAGQVQALLLQALR